MCAWGHSRLSTGAHQYLFQKYSVEAAVSPHLNHPLILETNWQDFQILLNWYSWIDMRSAGWGVSSRTINVSSVSGRQGRVGRCLSIPYLWGFPSGISIRLCIINVVLFIWFGGERNKKACGTNWAARYLKFECDFNRSWQPRAIILTANNTHVTQILNRKCSPDGIYIIHNVT